MSQKASPSKGKSKSESGAEGRARGQVRGKVRGKLRDEVPGQVPGQVRGKVTCDMSISLDGYAAGPNQRLDAPFGDGIGESLHAWMFEDPDANAAEVAAITDAGAFIMGRNMFGPGRGDWDLTWEGWWGPEPPYHAPVFVLTHHERPALEMAGGTTFHFMTGGITEALARARAAAGGRDVAIAGGAATVNQFLAAGLIDELRLHIAPVLIGRGERLFAGVDRTDLTQVDVRQTRLVTHIRYRPAAGDGGPGSNP